MRRLFNGRGIQRLAGAEAPAAPAALAAAPVPTDVFVSYCWADSRLAGVGPTGPAAGAALDPRAVAAALKALGLRVWLDVDHVCAGRALTLHEQLQEAIAPAALVVAFVSPAVRGVSAAFG